MADVYSARRDDAHAEPAIRRITTRDLVEALARGWQDFLIAPTQLVFLALIYPIMGLLLGFAASGRALMPLIWPLVAGFALLGPLAALGLYEISRQRELGREPTWRDAAGALRAPGLGGIAALGLVLLGLFAAWIAAAFAIHQATLGPLAPASLAELWRLAWTTPEGHRLLLVGNAVGFLFALAALCLSVVSFPLLLERDVGAGAAMRTSLRAVAANPGPMALWGLIVATILLLGALPLLVGLAVALPVLGHATWHLYRRVVA